MVWSSGLFGRNGVVTNGDFAFVVSQLIDLRLGFEI